MRKIPTLFLRDPDNRAHVLPEVHPDCQWVLNGEGIPTRKWDGTCTKLDQSGMWWARREVKAGKTPPDNYVPEQHDETTGKTVGWEPMAQSSFAKFHLEALNFGDVSDPGSYELIGPKINGNPEGSGHHSLIRHGNAVLGSTPRDFDGLRAWLVSRPYEGLVWHHPDGRMAKLKRRDFA